MTVTTLPMPKCSMDDGLGKLGDGILDLDSARFALAFLMETARPEDHSADTIQCIMNTLAEAAEGLKTGLDAVAFEHKAFKAWEAKNASVRVEAPS